MNEYAQQNGLSVYAPSTDGTEQENLGLNARVVRGAMDRGIDLVDLGPDETRTRLPWYSTLEQGLIVLRNYPRDVVDGADAPPEDCPGA